MFKQLLRFICVPPIPASESAITQETNWNAVRLGFNGEWRWGGWISNTDLAWIPYAWLNANDTHWQRIPFDFSGPTPELGNSFNNVQIEALLRYQFQNGFSVGIGGRYWRIDSSSAQAHFKSSAVGGGVPQTISLDDRAVGRISPGELQIRRVATNSVLIEPARQPSMAGWSVRVSLGAACRAFAAIKRLGARFRHRMLRGERRSEQG